MDRDELEYLEKVVSHIDISHLSYSSHSLQKSNTDCPTNLVESLLASNNLLSSIIELNVNKNTTGNVYDVRILVRDKRKFKVRMLDYNTGREQIELANLCIVYSLTRNQVITAYWNKASDQHRTIKWDNYNKKLNILDYKEFMEVCKDGK